MDGHNVLIYVAYIFKPKTTGIVTDSFPTSSLSTTVLWLFRIFSYNHRKAVAQKLTRAEPAGFSPPTYPFTFSPSPLRCLFFRPLLSLSFHAHLVDLIHWHWTATKPIGINKRAFTEGYGNTIRQRALLVWLPLLSTSTFFFSLSLFLCLFWYLFLFPGIWKVNIFPMFNGSWVAMGCDWYLKGIWRDRYGQRVIGLGRMT